MDLQLQSPEIDKLTTAFIKARQEFDPVQEDARANYGSYVSIAEIKACTHEQLLANGLSLTQTKTFVDGHVLLVTQLTHSSGQWMRSYMPLFVAENPKNIDQAYGASSSYQRRYEQYGLFGIMGEDLDPDSPQSPNHSPVPVKSGFASEAQIKLLSSLLVGKDELKKSILAKAGVDALDKLPVNVASSCISMLKEGK